MSKRPPRPTRPWRNERTGETLRVPVGIDPGLAFNMGQAAGRTPLEALASKINAAAPADARAAAADFVGSAQFRRFVRAETGGAAPVAVLPQDLGPCIRAKARAVLLSRDTAGKQLATHHNINARDYRRIQRMPDEGEIVRQSPGVVSAALEDGGEWWFAVVKATGDGSESYVVSYHRVDARRRPRARRRGEILRRVD